MRGKRGAVGGLASPGGRHIRLLDGSTENTVHISGGFIYASAGGPGVPGDEQCQQVRKLETELGSIGPAGMHWQLCICSRGL